MFPRTLNWSMWVWSEYCQMIMVISCKPKLVSAVWQKTKHQTTQSVSPIFRFIKGFTKFNTIPNIKQPLATLLISEDYGRFLGPPKPKSETPGPEEKIIFLDSPKLEGLALLAVHRSLSGAEVLVYCVYIRTCAAYINKCVCIYDIYR